MSGPAPRRDIPRQRHTGRLNTLWFGFGFRCLIIDSVVDLCTCRRQMPSHPQISVTVSKREPWHNPTSVIMAIFSLWSIQLSCSIISTSFTKDSLSLSLCNHLYPPSLKRNTRYFHFPWKEVDFESYDQRLDWIATTNRLPLEKQVSQ